MQQQENAPIFRSKRLPKAFINRKKSFYPVLNSIEVSSFHLNVFIFVFLQFYTVSSSIIPYNSNFRYSELLSVSSNTSQQDLTVRPTNRIPTMSLARQHDEVKTQQPNAQESSFIPYSTFGAFTFGLDQPCARACDNVISLLLSIYGEELCIGCYSAIKVTACLFQWRLDRYAQDVFSSETLR